MILYISGPMSSHPEDYNFPAFNAAAESLRGAGFEVVNPAEYGADEMEWADYLKRDIRWLLDCDGIALLPGWEDSKGARLERHIAVELGIRVHTVEMWLLLKTMADEYGPNRDSDTEGISA